MAKDRDDKLQKKSHVTYDRAVDQRRFSIGSSDVRRAAPTNHLMQALGPSTSNDKKAEKPKDKK